MSIKKVAFEFDPFAELGIEPPKSKRDREEALEKIAELVTRFGEEYARAALDLPRQTLARALAGLGIRRATADMIRTRLGKLSADG